MSEIYFADTYDSSLEFGSGYGFEATRVQYALAETPARPNAMLAVGPSKISFGCNDPSTGRHAVTTNASGILEVADAELYASVFN